MRRSVYEQAYDQASGVDSPDEPRHPAGVASQSIAAGASASFTLSLNMEMELEQLIIPDAIAPDLVVSAISIGAINLNAGDGDIPGDLFRKDSTVRFRPAVPITASQPLRVTLKNVGTGTVVARFGVIGKVARPK